LSCKEFIFEHFAENRMNPMMHPYKIMVPKTLCRFLEHPVHVTSLICTVECGCDVWVLSKLQKVNIDDRLLSIRWAQKTMSSSTSSFLLRISSG